MTHVPLNRYRMPFVPTFQIMYQLGPEMEFISEVVDLGPRSKKKMAANGVTTFQRLIEVVKEPPAIIDPNRVAEKELLKVINWATLFQEKNSKAPVMTEGGDSNEEIFYECTKTRGDFVLGTMPREDYDKLMRAVERLEKRNKGN